ncbi:response regulator, partial [bacterium]|nr:response regulator [bacterium]
LKKILIVDDLQKVRDLIAVTLSSWECEIFKAKNGFEAVEIAKIEKPDLIIMDLMMPEMNGISAIRIIKSDVDSKNCVIIVLTAFGADENVHAAIDAGADDYITKPFSPLELVNKVEKILG